MSAFTNTVLHQQQFRCSWRKIGLSKRPFFPPIFLTLSIHFKRTVDDQFSSALEFEGFSFHSFFFVSHAAQNHWVLIDITDKQTIITKTTKPRFLANHWDALVRTDDLIAVNLATLYSAARRDLGWWLSNCWILIARFLYTRSFAFPISAPSPSASLPRLQFNSVFSWKNWHLVFSVAASRIRKVLI